MFEFRIVKNADQSGYTLISNATGQSIEAETVKQCERIAFLMEDTYDRALNDFVSRLGKMRREMERTSAARYGLVPIPVFENGEQVN